MSTYKTVPTSNSTSDSTEQTTNSENVSKEVVGKVSRRLLGFLFILFLFSFLDRINIGFAGAAMSKDLGLTGAAFGFANTIFYMVYIACGVPSNIILNKLGARRWIATLVVLWGIASTCTMFAYDEMSLYIIRAIVGITEAGFLPGMLLYISRWFPASHRSRANSLFMIAMPITALLGSIASGFLLNLDGVLSLKGWQWVFMVEGLPCVLLGILVWYRLDDSPEQAKWLSPEEKAVLCKLIAKGQHEADPQATGAPAVNISRQLLSPSTIKCALIYFCMVTTMGMVNIWGPQIIAGFNSDQGNITTGILVAIPQLFTILAMLWLGSHSDKHQERRWHTCAPLLLGASGWLCTAFVQSPIIQLAGISLASMGAFGAMAVFWSFSDQALSDEAKAIGIALINAFGNSATIISSFMVGILKDMTDSFTTGIVYAAALMTLGAFITLTLNMDRRTKLSA